MTDTTNTIKGIEQGRAAFAYKKANEVAQNNNEPFKKKYKNGVVKKIPMMIKTNGLGATLAFAKSKGAKNGSDEKKAWYKVYNDIKDWLKQPQNNHLFETPLTDSDDLVHKVIQSPSNHYRMATVEVLAFFNWLCRFADGLIEGEGEN
jgi:CRISPR-associated protein Cmr5